MKPRPLVRSRAADAGRDEPCRPREAHACARARPAHRYTGDLESRAPRRFIRRHALLLCLLAPAVVAQSEVEVNTASRAQLESVPGLGPALVQRLLAARPFADWAELTRRVPGIRAATARKLSAAGLRVDGKPCSD